MERKKHLPYHNLLYILVGFIAQLVDGALGMAFGVISSSVLLSTGVAPAMASACIHAAEVVTIGLSGASHVYHKNVDWVLFRKLAATGVCGGIAGACLLTHVPAHIIKPVISVYLCVMALFIVYKAIKGAQPKVLNKGIKPLGLLGGFLDAVGGGGWGAIVVSTLIARGNTPRLTVGSVNLAEFFVAMAVSATFLFSGAKGYLPIALCLIIGGACAAPIAGYASKKMPPRLLMVLVSIVVLALGLWRIAEVFHFVR